MDAGTQYDKPEAIVREEPVVDEMIENAIANIGEKRSGPDGSSGRVLARPGQDRLPPRPEVATPVPGRLA